MVQVCATNGWDSFKFGLCLCENLIFIVCREEHFGLCIEPEVVSKGEALLYS